MKKYVNNSFINKSPSEYKNGTAVVTNLPVTIYTDGQPVTSWTMKGNTTTSGTPSPSNPVTIEGVGEETANLLFKKIINSGLNPSGKITEQAGVYNVYVAKVSEGDIVTVSNFAEAYAFYGSEPSIGSTSIDNTRYITYDTPYTITIPNGAEYIAVRAYAEQDNTMLNTGSMPLPYEPYGFKISILKGSQALTPIYVSQELYKLGDYSDSINSSGTATYYIVKKVLDGTETWTYVAAQSGGEYYFRTKLGNYGYVVSDLAISTHYSWTNITSSTSDIGIDSINSETANLGGIAIRDTNYANATAFAAYLAQQYENGTPVIVWYVLTTPTTESVTVPEITTTGGEVSIDVDTTVKPSEMDITYHGWHTHEPLKREDGQWV